MNMNGKDPGDIMLDYAGYLKIVTGLRNDIAERFPYPTLWAAMDKLVESKGELEKANVKMRELGLTADDAIRYYMEDN